ncbi:MAG TPA: bifunctional phosphopantothenoylcysteine decarboxylase/phosphopantothenate--cysteine ligase CoaBC [Candidatus Anoxymicrobiaceae bacterium]
MTDLAGKNVLLGVTGGIAAYKVAELARLLVKANANVKVVMTESGQQFVTPLTFRTLTGNPVSTTLWSDPGSPFPHISLGDEADIVVVAPATANIIAKMAHGIGDDLLSTILLAARGTIVVAPSMNTRMYLNRATQDNLGRIRRRGAVIVDPCEGGLACRTEGIGRMAEPPDIMEVIERELALSADLAGKHVLVTAGPTREYIDPVRFLSNPSTGLMGYTVAERAARRGAVVTLISGPVELACPAGVDVIDIVSAADMKKAVLDKLQDADVLIMAAAVADYTPAETADKKMKKSAGVPALKFESTADILKEVAPVKNGRIVVGFAAETDNVVENALKKLSDKDLDLIVANQVGEPGSGFGSATDLAAVIARGDTGATLDMMSKVELADQLLDRLRSLFK